MRALKPQSHGRISQKFSTTIWDLFSKAHFAFLNINIYVFFFLKLHILWYLECHGEQLTLELNIIVNSPIRILGTNQYAAFYVSCMNELYFKFLCRFLKTHFEH